MASISKSSAFTKKICGFGPPGASLLDFDAVGGLLAHAPCLSRLFPIRRNERKHSGEVRAAPASSVAGCGASGAVGKLASQAVRGPKRAGTWRVTQSSASAGSVRPGCDRPLSSSGRASVPGFLGESRSDEFVFPPTSRAGSWNCQSGWIGMKTSELEVAPITRAM